MNLDSKLKVNEILSNHQINLLNTYNLETTAYKKEWDQISATKESLEKWHIKEQLNDTIETFEEYIDVQRNYAKNELYQANTIYYDLSMELIETYLTGTSFDVDLKVIEKIREIVALIKPQSIDCELPF
ncbi:hypothetical protein N9906_03670 [Flavobacteriaceae bacterium]|jgi:hypothetical protein|nr:hypothetical protein [Flavobacteriaceae bacterium]